MLRCSVSAGLTARMTGFCVPPRHNLVQRSCDKAPACDPLAGGGQQFLCPRFHGGQVFQLLASIAGQGEVLWWRG